MKIQVKKDYKSIRAAQDIQLPDFVVFTGKNGSGKSHFMSAMANSEYCIVSEDGGRPLREIKYIPFNGLNPRIDEKCAYLGLANIRKEAWNKVVRLISEYKRLEKHGYKITFEKFVSSNQGRKKLIGKLCELVEWRIDDITEELFSDNYEITSEEIFTSKFAAIFKLYHVRFIENKFNKYLNETEGGHNKVLTDEEFERLYGPKPWDLINKMLERAGLTYEVNHPEGGASKELDFELNLTDVNTGAVIHVNDLSTGEKVLMSLALSIYNTKEENAKPDVLLLDEPDAALHPEYSQVLIAAIQKSIVAEAKVKVIISTHSPTTVAIAPEDSIFLMDKATSKPIKISKQQAVNILTKDLDNMRLSFEKRRQVFVESLYDAQYLSRVIALINVNLPTTPQFLPPKSSSGSNCDEVSSIVNALRRFGNDLVYGIKDFDNANHSSDYVFVLGENVRYAIDNYVFDPIYVALLLIREGVLKTTDMGLRPMTYVQLKQLSDADVQSMINYVIDQLGFSLSNVVTYTVQSNKEFKATKEYFMFRGHDLEEKIKTIWPQLNRIAQGGDNVLKNYVLDHVWKDYPEFISTDFVDLFMRLV